MRWKLFSLFVFLVLLVGSLATYFVLSDNIVREDSFEVDNLLFKARVSGEAEYSDKLEVRNLEEGVQDFSVFFDDLEGIAEVDVSEFSLGPGESKILNLKFSGGNNSSEGISVGAINILGSSYSKIIPVVLEIESRDVLFDGSVEIFPTTQIFQGDKINAQIKIYDISRIGLSSIEFEYFVKNLFDEVLISGSDSLIIDGQLSITRSVTLPDDLKEGDYVFGVLVRYKNSLGISSNLFRVEKEEKIFNLGNFYLFLIGVFVLILLLIFAIYSIYSRDRFLKELRNQYRCELRRQYKELSKKEKEMEKKLKTRKEKEASKRLFRKTLKKRKMAVQAEHRKRRNKVRKLKKSKRKNEIQRQIDEWKKKGYDTSVLGSRLKEPTKKDIDRQIRDWKRKGYNTTVLEKK